jgi:hypothetical protein
MNQNTKTIYVVGSFNYEYVIYSIFTTRESAMKYLEDPKRVTWNLGIKEETLNDY